jgi:type IV pilus assembly protein PilE
MAMMFNPSRCSVQRMIHGFTLLEIVVVLAIVSIVGAMAVPAYQASLARAQRGEAIDALTKLQLAQESFRANHGSYALALPSLGGMGEPLKNYRLDLVSAHAGGYIARATALNRSAQHQGCGELSLTVADGQPALGPSHFCWNR